MEKMNFRDRLNKISGVLDNINIINGVLVLVFAITIFLISLMKFEGSKLNISLGEFVDKDIRSTKEIVDIYGTEELKKQVYNSIQPKYRITPSIQISMKDLITEFFDTIRDFKIQTNISNYKKTEIIQESLDFELSKDNISNMLKMEYKELNHFENTLLDLINQLMGVGIREEDLEYEKENIPNTFQSLNLTDTQRSIGISLISEIIKPNKFIDEIETNRIRDIAVKSVEDIVVRENEIIAIKGEKIDKHKYELIKEAGLLKDSSGKDIRAKFGIGAIILIAIFSLLGYIYCFNKSILNSNRLAVFIIIMILTIFLSEGLNIISPYLIPVNSGGLLISILIDPLLGIMANIYLISFLTIVLGLDTVLSLMLMISGLIAIFSILNQKQRSNILLSGIIMAVINILIVTSFGFIKGLSTRDILYRDLQVLVNGLISVILAIGSLPLWENLFSILTPIKLLELSNPNNTLLKRLLVEAPGTYHHSLMVGNLSEAAANTIGANSLLVRVGAYYHDVGKLYKPYYFKENQFGMSNPHDLLKPDESVKIILKHVVEGISLAKEHKLPKEIIDFIYEHHGSTTVAYFYYQAKEKDSTINIEDFRYKGNKPQTKETALVMLADSVEAAVRSIKDPTKEKIEDMVNKIVKGKLNDGQLDECDITNKDINMVINSFVNVLLGIYHDRIEYPNMEITVEEIN